jgi:hypothetical protein
LRIGESENWRIRELDNLRIGNLRIGEFENLRIKEFDNMRIGEFTPSDLQNRIASSPIIPSGNSMSIKKASYFFN